jgi:hypothetical protein
MGTRAKDVKADGQAGPSGSGDHDPREFLRHDGFVMLGVIHRDVSGGELLDRWLTAVEPRVITVEFSNYGLTLRRELGPGYRRRIEEAYNQLKKNNVTCYDNALSMVISYVEMPYEFERTSRYGARHGVPVYPVDMDFFSYLRLREIDRLLSPDNLRRVLSEDVGRAEGYERAAARLYFEKGVNTGSYTDEMWARDRYMSNRIGVLKKRYKGRKFLHVCGWRHLDDPYNLYGPHDPVKVFIYDKIVCL